MPDQPGVSKPQPAPSKACRASRPQRLSYSAPTIDGDEEIATNHDGGEAGELMYAVTPRNVACPCGSGKKYKHCHGRFA